MFYTNIFLNGSYINDATVLGEEGVNYYVTKVIKRMTMGKGVNKIVQNFVTSLINDP